MSTPTLEETRPRMQQLSAGEQKAARLRERAAEVRRQTPHRSLAERDAEGRRRLPEEHRREAAADDRAAKPRSPREPAERAPERRKLEMKAVRDRMGQRRAEAVLANVRASGWWDNATAGDLERARRIANESGTPAANRSAIRNEMREVSQRRYGTSVDGAIRYERENPHQPPPDVQTSSGPVLR